MWGNVRLRRDTSPSRPLKSPIGAQCSNLSTKRRSRVALQFNRWEFHPRFLFVDLSRETDSPALGLGLLHQATDRVKHHLELPIVLVLQRCEFVRQILVRRDCLSQANKRPHDLDVYLDGAFTCK